MTTEVLDILLLYAVPMTLILAVASVARIHSKRQTARLDRLIAEYKQRQKP